MCEIPKVIHYIWFGGNEKPEIVKKCINSWKKYMPDYEIVEWNEKNYDVSKSKYISEAYKEKKWAFASDYARFDILNQYGGIYFDTDVELLKEIPEYILENSAFTGFESSGMVNPGLVFGTIPKHPFVSQVLKRYNNTSFHQDSKRGYKTVNEFSMDVLNEFGIAREDKYQYIDRVAIYPSTYFCGYDLDIHDYDIKDNTISVHHYASTWKKRTIKWKMTKIIVKMIGKDNYKRVLKFKRKLFGFSQ